MRGLKLFKKTMNEVDREVLTSLKIKYPESFKGVRVLELGSGNVNGTVRDYFEDTKEHIGVDFRKMDCVDLVSYAKDTKFRKSHFDTLISYSMIEHDPDWKESLGNNFPFIKKGGLIFLAWGGESNAKHGEGYGGHHPVPLKEVKEFILSLGTEELEETNIGNNYIYLTVKKL